MKSTRIACIADAHYPFVAESYLAAILAQIQDFRPTHICMLGDMIDATGAASEKYNPSADGHTVFDELAMLDGLVKQLRSICRNLEFVVGNHCWRVQRAHNRSPRLPIINIDNEIAKMGVTVHPFNTAIDLGLGWRAVHGSCAVAAAGGSVRKEMDRWGSHVIMGHVHRASFVCQTTGIYPDQTYRFGIECPCLCIASAPYDAPQSLRYSNWQIGWTALTQEGSRYEHRFFLHGDGT